MEKAVLVEMLKAKGLDIAEEALMEVVAVAFDVAEEVIKASENKYDDLALVVLPQLKSIVLKELDKLDKEVDLA